MVECPCAQEVPCALMCEYSGSEFNAWGAPLGDGEK